MPTIFRYGGFRIVINPLDHPPPHVHVLNADGYAVIEIETLVVRRYRDMRERDVVRAVGIVAEFGDTLLKRWREIHG
ncbi:MAG TPA: DUF4160 domain-containing protein [Longimicrobium sp.]|nr:DUF4160 domain-containing protein [Longimicrobium sp.]